MELGKWKLMLISGAVTTLCCVPAAQAGWVTVTNSGSPVLTACNPKPFTFPTPSTCLLTANTLVDAVGPNAILVRSNSVAIVANGVTVGTLYDRVYCYAPTGGGSSCAASGPNLNKYTLATRVELVATPWNGHSNESFEVNDIIRQILSGVSADSAYWMGPPVPPTGCGNINASADPDCGLANQKWVEYTGKTKYGLNDALMGTRDNLYIDHRNDANADDPDSVDSKWSAWVVVKQTCSHGVSTDPVDFSIKLWEGGEESQDHYTQWMPGFICLTQ
jgi:hypothetical protein